MRNKKGFTSIALLVVLLIVVGGTYFAVTHIPKTIKKETVTPPAATSDLKTYVNTQYGFELKYPADIFLEGPTHVTNTNGDTDRISLKNKENGLLLFLLAGKGSDPKGCFGPSPSLGNYSIAGETRQKCADTTWYGEEGGWEVTLPVRNQEGSLIYFDCFNGDSRCDQILSTFKFIK